MPKRVLAPIFLLLINLADAQISGVVADSESKAPIPFVNIWMESGTIGTTANEIGNFELAKADATWVFSAVGYETRNLKIADNDTVFMKPKPLELAEVKVGKGKNCQKKLGKIKGREVTFIQYSKDGKQGSPMIMARYFPNTCNKPIFLKKVKIKPSASAKATFNLRLYSVGEDGSPKDFLYNENILETVNSITMNKAINLEKLRVAIPENGIFVAIEWLIIDENKREPKTKYNSTLTTFWDPGITAVENPNNADTWSNSGGHWKRQPNFSLAMEVEYSE